MMPARFAPLLLWPVAVAAVAAPRVHVVCPAESAAPPCEYAGGAGIQQAVDAAADGDTIRLRAGRYVAVGFRDVPFLVHTIRGMTVIDGKDLALEGEDGVVLDGGGGPPTTALVVRGARVAIRRLRLTGFRFADPEDEIYEGHGIFVIGGNALIEDVVIDRFGKMALTGRGQSQIDARRLRIEQGHVAVWLRESAELRLRDSVVRNNDGSGIAAYASAVAHVENSVFDGNADDGLYADEGAVILVSNSMLLRNRPVGANAAGRGLIRIDHSAVFGNAKPRGSKGRSRVEFGADAVAADPRLDAAYRPAPDSPLRGRADTELGTEIGLVTAR